MLVIQRVQFILSEMTNEMCDQLTKTPKFCSANELLGFVAHHFFSDRVSLL